MALTKNDFRQIENLVDIKLAVFEEKIDEKFNKVMNVLDSILHEMTSYRMEQDVVGQRVSNVEERVDKVEQHVFQSS